MKYGLVNQQHLEDCAEVVCNCLGHGKNHKAIELLLETAGAETNKGMIRDASAYAGMGITQIDELPFEDIKVRARAKDTDKIKKELGIDMKFVEWEHLRYNPFLCILFTRLKYKKVVDPIPNTLEERAGYWKEYYNTKAGKGTTEHYIKANT